MTINRAAAEGFIEVPGGRLRYRWRPASLGPVLVFENGWAASHEQWTWVENELVGEASLLFYSHAGIGGSQIFDKQSVAGLSSQFAALLDVLDIQRPVVLVGHSFGGLICALHAAQQASRVAGLIQLDNTQEVDDALLDKPMKMIKPLSAIAIVCARLGIRDPLFSQLSSLLPEQEGDRMQRLAFGSPASIRVALFELSLLSEIRQVIATVPAPQPRLVISADRFITPDGLLARLLSKSRAETLRHLLHIQGLHKAQAKKHAGHWMTLPHSHSDLVFTPAGAANTARQIRSFVAAGHSAA